MDTLTKTAHFWRKASFGATLSELNSPTPPAVLVRTWLNDRPAIVFPQLNPINTTDRRQVVRMLAQHRREFGKWLLEQMIRAKNPLHEKMVNLWRDHFVVTVSKVRFSLLLVDYEQRLRQYAFGDFQELLWQVTSSPAMLVYLDNVQNRRGNINENFSREVMELFTIGRGNYTEKDIQEGARALTGLMIRRDRQRGSATAEFIARRHDPSEKVFLGKRGNFTPENMIEILANHPATPKLLAGKLWKTFAYGNPEPKVIERLVAAYRNNQRSIKAMMEVLFNSPEFYSAKSYRSQLKTPIYFMLGSIRQLGIRAQPERIVAALRTMGQTIYNPPTVKGWADDSGWYTAPSLLARFNLAQAMTGEYEDDNGFGFEGDRYSRSDLVNLLMDGKLDKTLQQASQGLNHREFAALLLASPTHQLV
ncbi:MAG: DUF1800 domain-containing protein [Oscillatoriales cyanobacterium SM2_2_1]|nr:DUF1800 domain-containing protein [Oscillatoriales cyanobacterium SM2_2_1]